MKIQYEKKRKKKKKSYFRKLPDTVNKLSSYKKMLLRSKLYLEQVENPVIIEIGACIGNTIQYMCQNLKIYRVYCIEACPTNFQVLQKISEKNKNIKTFNIAISQYDGEIDFYSGYIPKHRGSSQSSSVYKPAIVNKHVTSVKHHYISCMTLDSFCESNSIKRIDCLKLNCEGCEFDIFDCSTRYAIKLTKMLFIQMHGHCRFFNSPKFVNKKKAIMDEMTNRKFKFDYGHKDIYKKQQINQLWIK